MQLTMRVRHEPDDPPEAEGEVLLDDMQAMALSYILRAIVERPNCPAVVINAFKAMEPLALGAYLVDPSMNDLLDALETLRLR